MITSRYFLFVLFILASCGEDPMPQPIESFLLLKEIKIDGELITKYNYNAQNKLISYVGSEFRSDLLRTEFEYAVDAITLTNRYESGDSLQVLITNTGLMKYKYSYPAWNDFYIHTFDECGLKLIEYQKDNNPIELVYDYEFTDENCSYIRNKYTLTLGVNEKEIILKDGMQPPLRHILSHFEGFNDNSSNTVSLTKMYQDSNEFMTNIEQSYTSEFSYNSDAYPTLEIRTYQDGRVEERAFLYY